LLHEAINLLDALPEKPLQYILDSADYFRKFHAPMSLLDAGVNFPDWKVRHGQFVLFSQTMVTFRMLTIMAF
jgi:hypothetical protein